ncbi:mitochondrial carrier domain-containing protein, partial [Tribonema minus]
LAGVINVLLTTPLWVANTRIKTAAAPANRKAPGLIGTLCLVYKEDGLAGLWAGTVPSLVLVTNPIIQFVAYDYLKRVLLGVRAARGGAAQAKLQLRAHEAFVLGAIAKALATVLTYPLQLAQSKMRAASRVSQQKVRICTCRMGRYMSPG